MKKVQAKGAAVAAPTLTAEEIGLHTYLRAAGGDKSACLQLPLIQSEISRRRGAKKPRRADINEWIGRAVTRDPSVKAPALWANAPEWLTDQIGEHAFRKRLTEVRKKCAASK